MRISTQPGNKTGKIQYEMGTPVPDEWPEFEDEKHYLVNVDAYQFGNDFRDCRQDHLGRYKCCVSGDFLNSWLADGHECLSPFELCVVSGASAQRLVAVHGPYDTPDACTDDL